MNPASTKFPQSEVAPADDFNARLQAKVEAANDLEFLVSELERVVERQRFKRICGPNIWKQMNKARKRERTKKIRTRLSRNWGISWRRGGRVRMVRVSSG